MATLNEREKRKRRASKHAERARTCRCGRVIHGNGYYRHRQVCPAMRGYRTKAERSEALRAHERRGTGGDVSDDNKHSGRWVIRKRGDDPWNMESSFADRASAIAVGRSMYPEGGFWVGWVREVPEKEIMRPTWPEEAHEMNPEILGSEDGWPEATKEELGELEECYHRAWINWLRRVGALPAYEIKDEERVEP